MLGQSKVANKLEEHRREVLTHLEYIKGRVDYNAKHLDKINGRLREAEKKISFLQGFGSIVSFVLISFSSVLAYFLKK